MSWYKNLFGKGKQTEKPKSFAALEMENALEKAQNQQEILQIINANRKRFQVVQSARRLKNGKFFSVTDKPVLSRERASESVSSGFISLMDTLNFTNEIKWKVSSRLNNWLNSKPSPGYTEVAV